MRVFRRFRDVDIGNGCVLWCPFYKLDGGAAKAYDFSGAGNHGTIATPVRSALPRYGPNKVVNSTFATDTIWTKGAGWTINTVAAIAVAGVASDLEQDISAVNGETYLLQYSMSRTAGTVTPSIGATAGTARSATGYYSELITAAGTDNLKFSKGDTFAGTVDNVVVRKVLPYRTGSVWEWNGTTDLVTFGTGSALKPDAWTVLMWLAGWVRTSYLNAFTWTSNASSPAVHISQAQGSGAVMMGAANYQYFTNPNTNPNAGDAEMHHIGVTCPGAADADVTSSQFLLDGVSCAKGAAVTTGAQTAKTGFYVGNTALTPLIWVGEILLYNRVLSVPEILTHYNLSRHRWKV